MPGDSWDISSGDDPYGGDPPRRGVADFVEADFLDAARVSWRVNSDGHVTEIKDGWELVLPYGDHVADDK